jgi:hypothetical protein
MDMQMQLKRGIIAVMIWAVLGGVVLSRAGTPIDGRDPAPLLVSSSLADSARECQQRLRIELTSSLRVTIPCDHSCKPLRSVAHVLHLPVAMIAAPCDVWHTA